MMLQTCQPNTDHVGIFQASLVVEDYWKPNQFGAAKQANFKLKDMKK